MRKPGRTALEGSLCSLRDGIDGFTGKENIRSFIMIIKIITEVLIISHINIVDFLLGKKELLLT